MTISRALGAKRREGGFFLLEAVIGLGLFAFAIIGLASAVEQVVAAERDARLLQEARMETESLISETTMGRIAAGTEEIKGASGRIVYRREIEELDLTNQDLQRLEGMFSVRITALPTGDKKAAPLSEARFYVHVSR